jgi:hypothetical protein
MKLYAIIFAIVIAAAGCSSLSSGGLSGQEQLQVTIALDRSDGSDQPSGSLIHQVQKKLTQSGYNPGPVDGIWGSKTQKAVEQFQQDNALPVTGILDAETRHRLLSISDGSQKGSKSPVGRNRKYVLMTALEARQLIGRHIRQKDIRLETNAYFRASVDPEASGASADTFQGVRFDDRNYLVFALCEPAYRMVSSLEDLPARLAKRNIHIPDKELSVTFNGVIYSTVDLEVKSNPAYQYAEHGGFIERSHIPKGGYQWLIGDFGMRLDNIFIFFQNPMHESTLELWRSPRDIFEVKLSLPEEKGVNLNLYRP